MSPGEQLRQTALILAQNNNTPASYWLTMRLSALHEWVRANNQLQREIEEARKQKK